MGKDYKGLEGLLIQQRMLCIRNKLPEDVLEVGTVVIFKGHLNGYVDRNDSEGFGQVGLAWLGNLIGTD